MSNEGWVWTSLTCFVYGIGVGVLIWDWVLDWKQFRRSIEAKDKNTTPT